VYNSIKFLQQALQYLNEPVIDDGVMGLQTLNYTNKWCKKDPEALFKAMNGEQYIYYKAIKQKKYKWGWLKRIQAFIRK
jgi:lysozyme family protein